MKIKNISVKPICIGGAACEDAVPFYIDMGYVQEVQEKKARKAKAEPEPASDASAEAES